MNRRKFFSFFGTGVAMLAAPGLFIPDTSIKTFTQADLDELKVKIEESYKFLNFAEYTISHSAGPIFMLAT